MSVRTAFAVLVLLVVASCGSSDVTESTIEPELPPALDDAVRSFAGAWSTGSFAAVAEGMDGTALAVYEAALESGELAEVARPSHHLPSDALVDVDDVTERVARLLAAVHRAAADPIDVGRPISEIVGHDVGDDDAIVDLVFADGSSLRMTLRSRSGEWRFVRADQPATTARGAVWGLADPVAGTGLAWCGFDQPVVFDGIDCARVLPGTDGLDDDERAALEALREEATAEPSRALELTQAMQGLLAGAPGQVCRLMQTGGVPVGEAQRRAEELASSTCPFSEPLEFDG